MIIPEKLAAVCQEEAALRNWLTRLPATLSYLQQQWSIDIGSPFLGNEGSCAWVAPVTLQNGTAAVLKLGMPHLEGEHEIAGLRFWDGNPTVRLLAADDDLGAMLLERCVPGSSLRELPEPEQDVIIAALLRRLWRAPLPPHPFRPLSVMLEFWSSEVLDKEEHWPDAGLVHEGLRLFTALCGSSPAGVILATDTHAGNVLRAQREPWLLIDPKPFLGDPAYDATQHLLNCQTRLSAQPDRTIRHFADLLALDHERVRLWTFARIAVRAGEDWRNPRWVETARALGN